MEGKDVLMFYSCPTTERHIRTPRKREAMSERTRVRDRWTENNMSQRKNKLDRERQRGGTTEGESWKPRDSWHSGAQWMDSSLLA